MKNLISILFLFALIFLLCSCEVTDPIVTPTGTLTLEPTPTPIPPEDTLPHPTKDFNYGVEYILSASFENLEICKCSGGTSEYLSLNVKFHLEESFFTENIGSDDYEYTWMLIYHDTDIPPDSFKDMIGEYTITPKECEILDDGYTLFKLSVSDAPEGDFTKDLEVDKAYMLIVPIAKGEKVYGFGYFPLFWTEELAEIRDNFYAANGND